jgi:hypothetical protein
MYNICRLSLEPSFHLQLAPGLIFRLICSKKFVNVRTSHINQNSPGY